MVKTKKQNSIKKLSIGFEKQSKKNKSKSQKINFDLLKFKKKT